MGASLYRGSWGPPKILAWKDPKEAILKYVLVNKNSKRITGFADQIVVSFHLIHYIFNNFILTLNI
jgi:hypothetical protein